MKYVFAFAMVLALASSTELMDQRMLEFMQLKASAGDAVDMVMDVLNGLKQSALDERAELDEWHDATENDFARRIGGLTSIMNTNRGIYDAAIANREFVEAEIEDTANYMAWIENRFLEIDAMVAELHDERCTASLLFVTRCREHMEALTALDLLRQDILDWEAAGMPISLVEIKKMPSFNKLSAYTNLFKKNALNNFLSLTQDDDYLDEARRTAEEVGDDHVDNDQGALDLEDFMTDRDDTGQTIIGKFLERLDLFEQHLHDSMQDLIDAEVRAGRDSVLFIQESEKETHVLQVELERRQAYAAKLENDLVLALEHEASTQANWEASVAAVNEAKAELQAHRDFYMAEVERLANDVEVVEEVIKIFLQELQGIDDIIRNQQYDEVGVVDDDRFGEGMFGSAEVQTGPYTGAGGWEAAVAAGL